MGIQTVTAFTAHSAQHMWDYAELSTGDPGYNTRSELEHGVRYEQTSGDPNPANLMIPGHFRYDYDKIGNREASAVSTDAPTPPTSPTYTTTDYTADDLNRYTGADQNAVFDADGNLTDDGTYTYRWDYENRLIAVETKSPEDDELKLSFAYDYMGRRVQKRVYEWDSGVGQNGDWVEKTSDQRRMVYDGWNVALQLIGKGSEKGSGVFLKDRPDPDGLRL